jgi:outer membrane lipoprotein-sorting protein
VVVSPACAGKIPLPRHLAVGSVDELRTRLQGAKTSASSYTAEARLTYFGPRGRVRGTASLAVKRPASLRLELLGPHGGVLEAFATNGRELQLSDLKASRFYYGPATPAHIDALLGIATLQAPAERWVELLFGEIALPGDARLSYDDEIGRFVLTWQVDAAVHRVEVDPASSRVVAAEIRREGAVASRVLVEERDERGLPIALRLRVESPPTDVEIRLRDVAYDAELADDVFVLTPPRNVKPEYLSEDSNIQRVY